MRADDPLHTTTGLRDGTAVVSLEGELDVTTVEPVVNAVAWALRDRPQQLDLDVTDLDFCDAAGLRALLRARRMANVHHVDFRLVGAGPKLCHLLTVLRATFLLPSSLPVSQVPGRNTVEGIVPMSS
ncbi:STAS domain-containing protein [Kitasatospora sp. NPDC093550]|uniref:STAS domain-containing protein n=1 Tax=Kitasatospora sp. NPDC093550 TaxID=3364089 RepID=UPI0038112C98